MDTPTEGGWLSERSRNGGFDEIPVPGRGRLWLCGKHFIGPDVESAMSRTGATFVVCLNERTELEDRYPAYVTWLQANAPARAHWFPIPDLHAPVLGRALPLVAGIRRRLDAGDGVLMHCGAGIGRAGTIAVAVLVSLGADAADALRIVSRSRPGAGPEAGAQADLVAAFARLSVGSAQRSVS